ncbi:aminotransferase class V-fold PLP-dependent enzyme [Flavobacterium poyangense]|uniref:aminotransferase class V-fold PLP-dependent enzyme n=1 Tax=Flavobacterium poyangense TaxID=2204302 RepID=UPI001FBA31C6|nr:aminotransferase class V-fold PLP-dependent enzyme [Flavobacterium sp. JXAS1]
MSNSYGDKLIGQALNKEGVAVQTGHHCVQPILRRMSVETTVRPPLAFYNKTEGVDIFIKTLWELKKYDSKLKKLHHKILLKMRKPTVIRCRFSPFYMVK